MASNGTPGPFSWTRHPYGTAVDALVTGFRRTGRKTKRRGTGLRCNRWHRALVWWRRWIIASVPPTLNDLERVQAKKKREGARDENSNL
ncbi:hypothetical protein [Longibacter salinarum]|uniref:hypothetical protein n=1 Tax=Longibacter salinarum TaxID=1850348 RepID=UPI0011807FFA|nr:hypothetical protein [Longibacter salinarum]